MDPDSQQPQHETIIPLIKIYRKLEKCNVSQLSQWLSSIPIYFSESKSFQVFIKILLKTLCDHHSEIPQNVLDAILLSSPNENALINLDDSITKSSLNDDKEESDPSEPITILQIPTDLQIICFNFLHCKDLYQVQKTCRSLNISSRNPNSLCCKDIWKSNINYSHHFYSRIKHLRLHNFSVGWNPKWNDTVQKLYAYGTIECASFPQLYFENIQKCDLSRNAVKLFGNGHIKQSSLNILSLASHSRLDIKLWESLIQCVNLKKLTLTHLERCDMDLEFLRQETSPFKQLTYLETDSRSMIHAQILFSWILSENSCSKTFKLTVNSRNFDPFSVSDNLLIAALQNISGFYLSTQHLSQIERLLDNIVQNVSFTSKKFDYFELDLAGVKQLNSDISVIQSMLVCCRSSKLIIFEDIYSYQDSSIDNEWFLKILHLQIKEFDDIEINFVRVTPMNLWDDPKSADYFDDLKNIGFEQISERFAMWTVNDYEKWCKPLLEVRKRTIKMHYSHFYDWDNVLGTYENDFDVTQQSVEDFKKMLEDTRKIWNDSIEPKIDEIVTERINNEEILKLYINAIEIDWNS